MLEHRVLLVRGRTTAPVQSIVDGESGAALGFVRWEPETGRSWWRRFGRGVLAVHEQEDEPLLFTIRRAWSLLPRRLVCDAEGHPVGSVLGRYVHDHHGVLVAVLADGVFRSPYRRVLAELISSTEGMRLTFGDDIAGEPFIKMLILAAVLQMTR